MAARRHVLVGGGPASVAAAEAIRAEDPTAQITLLCADPHGYYSRPGLAYFLAKEVPERQLFPFSADDFAALGVQMLHEQVIGIDRSAHRVVLASGRDLPYDRLLIATGSSAIALRVPGAQLDGVVKLDDMDDAHGLIARSGHAMAAVVVGGGITGLEIVEGLCLHHTHVHYFMRKERYWSNVLSETESRIVEDGLKTRGVQLHTYTELAEVLGQGGRVSGVLTQTGERIDCGMVAVAIGVLPNVGLAENAGIRCARGVLVDEFLRSSDLEIFAAGDVAEVYDARTDRRAIEVLWSSAVEKGRVAGRNMAAEPVHRYQKGAPLNVTRLAGFKITIIGTVGSGQDSDLQGIARGDSESWRQLGEATVIETRTRDAHVRLAVAGGRIVGAVVMGDQALSFPLQDLISGDADVTEIAAGLAEPRADVAGLIDERWRSWGEAHV